AHLDFYTYAGPGVGDTTLQPTAFVRRLRPEVSGEILQNWAFMIGGEFGATALDNNAGNATETRAAVPGATPSATTGTYAAAQTTRFQAAAADVFVNYHAHPLFNAQFGQYDANFTMENRTSDKYFPFIERSLAVRNVGIPSNKEIGLMLW